MFGFYYQVGTILDIIFYAGSLRPGGGLTVAKIMIEAMAKNQANNIVVYTGAKDSSLALNSVFESYDNVHEKQFMHSMHSEVRYAFSKVFFLSKSLFKRKTLLISINYFIPTFYKQFVYHLNLLSFMRQARDGFPKKIKEFDAKLACRFATINVFESDYLRETAEEYTGVKIRNPKRLYIGIDPSFYSNKNTNNRYKHNANIILVSSPQPHKDNQTCIDALKNLSDNQGEANWKLIVVGGQSVKQWTELKDYTDTQGVADKVEFLGPVDKTQLSTLMHQSLCLISASKIESFCMVALEAMASECPAIVTDDTSMPESVGEAAIVVESGSSEQFAQSILDLYNNENLRNDFISKGNKRTKKFSTSAFNQNLRKLL